MTTFMAGSFIRLLFWTMLAVNTSRDPFCILPVQLHSYLRLCPAVFLLQSLDETEKCLSVWTYLPYLCVVCPLILSLHMLMALPVFPWYTLELFCILSGHLADHNSAKPDLPPGLPFFPPSVTEQALAFLIYALGYGMMASRLSLGAIRFFSAAVFLL